MTLLEKLIEKQKELGMEHKDFAKHLGISRQLWVMHRMRLRDIHLLTLSGVVTKFPELIPEVLFFLRNHSTVESNDTGEGREAS